MLTDASIAFHVARLAQEEGATVVLTVFGRTMKITQAIARRLPEPPPVVELDVHDHERPRPRWPTGSASTSTGWTACVHSIGFAPQGALAATSSSAAWDDVVDGPARLGVLAEVPGRGRAAADGRAAARSSGLTFDAPYAWPVYDWMGVAKAAFESTARYLARDLGPEGRAGQPRRGRPDPDDGGQVDPRLRRRSRTSGPSGRRSAGTSATPSRPPRACVALLSDWFPATTGEIVHVDGGVHAMG